MSGFSRPLNLRSPYLPPLLGFISCIDVIDEEKIIVGTSSGSTYNLSYDKKKQEYQSERIYGNDTYNEPKAKRDNQIWTISHLNESHFILFNDSGELKQIQVDNNVMKTLGQVGKSTGEAEGKKKFKKFFGKMFKLDFAKEWVYWKKSNHEIVRIQLKEKKPVSQSFKFDLKKEDYIIDFDLDEKNQSLYALSHLGEIMLLSYKPNKPLGVVKLNNERSSDKHYFTCMKISKDYDYMAIGSFCESKDKSSSQSGIRVKVFMIMEDRPSNPKIKYIDEKLIPLKKENGKCEYIQCLDFSLERENQLFLSIFLRRSCQVLILKLEDCELKHQPYELPRMESSWINDISNHGNRVFACFDESNLIGELKLNEDEQQ